jgi:SAM-dependent methyltransferase
VRSRTPEERALRAASFNGDPELYDRARPKYPDTVYQALWKLAKLSGQPKIVEVGCGTGQASVDLAKRGAELTCVEFGDQMAALARRNLSAFPSATVEVSKFEEWDNGDRHFNLLFASASWHWIEPVTGHQKAASVLASGGSMAIVSSEHVYPEGFDPLFGPIQDIYGDVTGSKIKWPPKPPEGGPDSLDENIDASGLFEKVQAFELIWHFERTADEYIDLLGTYSDNRVRDPEERAELFSRIHKVIAGSKAGFISKHYLTRLRVARRLDS